MTVPRTPFGVYVHIPFCIRRCDYCAFATWADRGHVVDDYLDALATEIARAVETGMVDVTSVFVGGGTPSVVPAAALARILRSIPLAAGAEVTVECNPDTVTSELADTYASGGVTRVSLGVQSMDPLVLRSLGRSHDPTNVEKAVGIVRNVGFESFNVDLIYGAQAESIGSWRSTLDAVIALDPPHVSAYALTVEAGTPLAADSDRHPDEDDQADKYLLAGDVLTAAGFDWYEISNWALPGNECRHNLLYWDQGDYLGFGCAAHSHRSGRRWWNVRTPERYIEAMMARHTAEAGCEVLDAAGRHVEALQLALRTSRGVPTSAFESDDLELLAALVDVNDDRVVLNAHGRLLANEVALRLH